MAAPGSLASWNVAPGSDVDLKKKMAFALLQQSMDASPVGHWTQALARAAQGGMGGLLMNASNQDDEAERSRGRDLIAALSGGTQTVPQAPVPQAPISPTAPRPMSGDPRGFRNNNPLNIEAGAFTQGQPGFSGSDGRFARFASMDQGVGAADKLLQVYANKHGLNTVGGIVNRWAPPSDNNPTSTYAATVAKAIGVDPNAPVDMADPAMRQKIIRAMAQFENGRPLPQMAQAPVGAPVDQPRGGMSDPRRMQIINSLVQNRYTAPIGQQLLVKELDREATRARPLTEEEKKIYPGAVAIKAGGEPIFPPPATNISLSADKEGSELMAKKGVENFDIAQNASRDAGRRIAGYGQMLEAMKGFTPGATAELRLQGGRLLKDLGITSGEGVPDAETFKAIQRRLELAATPKGQGQITENERVLIRETIPSLTTSPEGIVKTIQMLDRLDRYDQQVAQVYRENAKRNGGRPNYLEVTEEIAKLPPPLTDSEMNSLQNARGASGSSDDGWRDVGNGVRIREKK